MALAEDSAAVLEQFIHDVANLPAEVAHLFEEAQAKQDIINECTAAITKRDDILQKSIKNSGSLLVHPKEGQYNKAILENYDRAQRLQDEKVALIQKASTLLDRYVKRLDIKIRDLQSEGSMPVDPSMPSLLCESAGNKVAPASSVNTGTNTPLQPLPINTMGGSTSIANAAVAQLERAAALGRSRGPAAVGMPTHPLLNSSHLANAPSIAAMNARAVREGSNPLSNRRQPAPGRIGPFAAQSSSQLAGDMRPRSLQPGTPKPGTPGTGRAGSVPRSRKAAPPNRRLDPRQQLLQRKRGNKNGTSKKSSRHGHLINSARASPSTTGEDSGVSDDGSDDENGSFQGGVEDDNMDIDDEGTDDLTKYCYCQKVSYGDMVACDNSDCKGQWFHWDCAGITSEPKGEWLCRDCIKLPRNKIRKA